MNLFSPIEEIPGIGPIYQKRLKKLGIKAVKDLLYHFPSRYQDLSKIIPISQIRPGEMVTITGKILDVKNARTWKKRISLTEALVEDKTGTIKIIWFHQPYLAKNLERGRFFLFSGKISLQKNHLYLSNPVWERIDDIENIETKKFTHAGRLVPIYPATEGVSPRYFRYVLKRTLASDRKSVV